MDHPTTRVLTLLELLQSHGTLTGAEIARHLEVDPRTARRYIGVLEEIGIPVTADRGRAGGYRLVPGYKLPPLMLTEDEALALSLSLRAAHDLGIAAHAPALTGALAKVHRVLPPRILERVQAAEEIIRWDFGEPSPARPAGEIVQTFSAAARDRQTVRLRYCKPDGTESDRGFNPYGLVFRRKTWYAIGHCHLRREVRLFRLDRVQGIRPTSDGFERPAGFDIVAELRATLETIPRAYEIDVSLQITLEAAQRLICLPSAVLEEEDGGIRLRGATDDLDRMARLLASLGCPLTIHHPPALRDALRRHAAQIAAWAEQA